MVRRSKYYIAKKSWTKAPAWAFEVPVDYIESEPGRVVTLRSGPRDREPVSFRRGWGQIH
jgi:hypothetical protein